MKLKLWRIILWFFYPFIRLTGGVYVSFHKKLIDGKKFSDIESLIRPGDILFSYTRGEFSNLYNPGTEWGHGAVYRGNGKIIEAIGIGVVEDSLENFCFKKDYIAITRPPLAASSIGRMIAWLEDQIGKPYDYQFEDGDEEYFCWELIGNALEYVNPNIQVMRTQLADGHFYSSESFLVFKNIYNSREA